MLLERDGELDLLAELLGESSPGGKVVLIRGEAGIGKSALVRAFLDGVGDSAGAYVGYCDDLRTPQPFAPFWDIARDVPPLREALAARDRYSVFEALIGLFAGDRRPTVVVIEDTHWSDEATLDAIRYVGRRIARLDGLLVLTYREGEVDVEHPLRQVIGELPPGDVVRIELGGLSLTAVTTIVGTAGADPERILAATRGNPFLVTEMTTAGDDDALPASIRDAAMARVARLSAPARVLVRALAVVPDRIDRNEASALAADVDGDLAECERLGLLQLDRDSIGFRHDLLRRAVEASLTVSEQVAMHRLWLDRLPGSTDPARMVHHARAANDAERLIEFAPGAARAAAAVGSHREALVHFRALDPYLGRLPEAERGEVLLDWARVEHYLGNGSAKSIVDRAIDLVRLSGSERGVARALTLGARIKAGAGRYDEAFGHIGESIGLLRPLGPSADLVAALSQHAWLMIGYGEGPTASVADEAIAMATEIGDELAAIDALTVRATLALVQGEPDGLSRMEHARSVAAAGKLRFEETSVLQMVAWVLLEVRDLDRAADFCRRARDTAERYEIAMLEHQAASAHAQILLWMGSWEAAEDLATTVQDRHPNDELSHVLLGVLHTRDGRPGGLEHLERAWALAGPLGTAPRLGASTALAERAWLVGDVDPDLLASFAGVLDDGLRTSFPWPAGGLALWLWKLGVIAGAPAGLPEPYAAAIDGDVRAAAAFWEARKAPYERAVALLGGDHADRLAALEALETLGATAVAAKVRKELRDDGVIAQRGRGRATRRNVAGLTARQAEILALLAEGLTNPQIADRLFVSPRTVENHVSAILAKLHATTRDEAVARAREEGLLADSGG